MLRGGRGISAGARTQCDAARDSYPFLLRSSAGELRNRIADQRAQPLAQVLAAVPAGVLERAGAILMDELRMARQL